MQRYPLYRFDSFFTTPAQSDYMTSLAAQHQLVHHPPVDDVQLQDQGKHPCICAPSYQKSGFLLLSRFHFYIDTFAHCSQTLPSSFYL